jgi:hypothetical protein
MLEVLLGQGTLGRQDSPSFDQVGEALKTPECRSTKEGTSRALSATSGRDSGLRWSRTRSREVAAAKAWGLCES